MSEARLILAAEKLAEKLQLDEEQQVEALKNAGFEEGEANRLVVFLPLAFSRPALEELGIEHFAPVVGATNADGTPFEVLLARQPEYVVGLEVARKHRRMGFMDQEVFASIAGSSAEIDAVSKALNAGEDIRGGAIASALVGSKISPHLVR
jgi:hypothetical protein